MTGSLIICPDCLQNGQRHILGSVTNGGDLIIRRFTNGVQEVTVKSVEYMIVCNCGFGTVVTNTTPHSYTYSPRIS